jgi:NADP-dependent 3-hydroxy acid dehydrogenase YdfG
VVSGGARGITAEAIVALAQRIQLRFLVLGRTPLIDEHAAFRGVTDTADLSRLVLQQARASGDACSPTDVRAAVAGIVASREAARTLTRLREAGSEVRHVATDVADARAVGSAVDMARRAWGPITGLIHGAGAVADAWLRDKTESHVDRVFAPKLLGLANLLAATAGDPLRLICAFSSVAAHVGNVGQADYAMANSILERVIAAEAVRRGSSCQVRALAWGPWDTGMVTPQLREKFAHNGVPLIAVQAGCTAFVRELASRSAETTVLLTPQAAEQRPGDRIPREHVGASPGFRPALANDIEP